MFSVKAPIGAAFIHCTPVIGGTSKEGLDTSGEKRRGFTLIELLVVIAIIGLNGVRPLVLMGLNGVIFNGVL